MNTTKKLTATVKLKKEAEHYMILFGIIMQFSPKVINDWNMHISQDDTLGLYIDIACGEWCFNDGQGNTVYFSLAHSRADQIITAIKQYIELNEYQE
jgi:hypothetical protein